MIIDNEKIVCFDIDKTLVKPSLDGDVVLSLYGIEGTYKIFHKNVEQIKTHLARGWYIIVWSNNGPGWAKTVIDYLKIDQNKIQIMNKPIKIFDDEDATVWMPKRIHLHEDEIY